MSPADIRHCHSPAGWDARYRPNTSFSGYDIPVVEGHGYITYTIPYLPLLEGLYYFSVRLPTRMILRCMTTMIVPIPSE